jgi:hypothetical protein
MRGGTGRTGRIVLLCCLGAGPLLTLSACAHANAKAAPDAPPLEMPAPPPRDVEPADVEAPPPMPLAQEPAHNAPARPRPAPPAASAPAREQPKSDAAKPDQPADAPKPEDAPKPPAAAPPATLQTAPATVESEVERGIRTTLVRAQSDLSRVDYRALNTDARTQYDTAKRFIDQAGEAMKAKNFVIAKNVADKAAVLAAQLAGR